jgi:hypothetical protein
MEENFIVVPLRVAGEWMRHESEFRYVPTPSPEALIPGQIPRLLNRCGVIPAWAHAFNHVFNYEVEYGVMVEALVGVSPIPEVH